MSIRICVTPNESTYVYYPNGGFECYDATGLLRMTGCLSGSHKPILVKPTEIKAKPIIKTPTVQAEANTEAKESNLEARIQMALLAADMVITEMPQAVADYRSGKKAAINSMLGAVKKRDSTLDGHAIKIALERKLNV